MTYLFVLTAHIPESTMTYCRNSDCGSTQWIEKLDGIDDAQERLMPGAETPAGQCPGCGAFAYLSPDSEQADMPPNSALPEGSDLHAAVKLAIDALEARKDMTGICARMTLRQFLAGMLKDNNLTPQGMFSN